VLGRHDTAAFRRWNRTTALGLGVGPSEVVIPRGQRDARRSVLADAEVDMPRNGGDWVAQVVLGSSDADDLAA
jgi:hypothetical protein